MKPEVDYLTCDSYSEELLVSFLTDLGETALDVGTGSGRLTRFLSARSDEVHSFECNPKHIGAIEKGIAGAWEKWSKSSSFDNITLHKVAVSSKDGTTMLRAPKNSYGWGTVEESNRLLRKREEGIDEFEVNMSRIDTIGGAFKNVGFLKVDVEGHEPDVLAGAEQLLRNFGPALYLEIYEGHSPGVSSKVRNRLSASEYDGYFLRGEEVLPIELCDFTKHLTAPPSQCDINFIFTKSEQHKQRVANFVNFSKIYSGKMIEVRSTGLSAQQ